LDAYLIRERAGSAILQAYDILDPTTGKSIGAAIEKDTWTTGHDVGFYASQGGDAPELFSISTGAASLVRPEVFVRDGQQAELAHLSGKTFSLGPYFRVRSRESEQFELSGDWTQRRYQLTDSRGEPAGTIRRRPYLGIKRRLFPDVVWSYQFDVNLRPPRTGSPLMLRTLMLAAAVAVAILYGQAGARNRWRGYRGKVEAL
jgi:hypothetical protein